MSCDNVCTAHDWLYSTLFNHQLRYIYSVCIPEGSLEVKLPTIWTDEKQSREEAERRERLVRRKKMQMREKVGKSRNTVFFQWFGAPAGRKVGSLSGGCGASWPEERWKIERRCGVKHIWKSKCTKHATFRPLLGSSVDSLCHPWVTTTNLSYRFPIFETSATALCGTTGNQTRKVQVWDL